MLATAAVSLLICSTNRQRGTAAPDYIPVIQAPISPPMSLYVAAHRAQGGYARALAVTQSETPTVVPVSTIRRVALSDVVLRGRRIAAGDTVVLALLAANRDPAVFARPDEFRVDRPNAGRQVGFTVGPYSCMGQALARLEGRVFFTTLLTRFPRMAPVDPQPDWMVFRPLGRELRTLRVRLDGRP